VESAKRACDFLATEVGVPRYEGLPYANQFAVLCEIFRRVPNPDGAQLTEIRKWFWRTTLAGYFGGWNTGQMASDLTAIAWWASGKQTKIDIGATTSNEKLWRVKQFRSNSAVAKMVALTLSQASPRDVLNGQRIDPGKSLAWGNDKEFHHEVPPVNDRRVRDMVTSFQRNHSSRYLDVHPSGGAPVRPTPARRRNQRLQRRLKTLTTTPTTSLTAP
jgi:hypothetical protein